MYGSTLEGMVDKSGCNRLCKADNKDEVELEEAWRWGEMMRGGNWSVQYVMMTHFDRQNQKQGL